MTESTQSNGTARRLLVPLADTVTVRDAVDYAVAEAQDGAVHLVVAVGETHDDLAERRARDLLNRARAWAREDAQGGDVRIETAVLGADNYLFGPTDYARLFHEHMERHDLDALVLDPEYWSNTTGPLVESFRAEITGRDVPVERPDTPRPARHERITARWSFPKLATVFVISYAFYLLLGDPFYWFDLLTGGVVAAIVAITLSHVTYGRTPRYPRSIYRTLRFTLYIPYLAWEIIKANVIIAMVILHPAMPIDPQVTRVRARVDTGLPTLALANSITLTPGTLTVRAEGNALVVHTLVPAARRDLFGGRLERAIRFVFYGRGAAAIPTPEERGDAEALEAGEEW